MYAQVRCRIEGLPGVEVCAFYAFAGSADMQAQEREAAEVIALHTSLTSLYLSTEMTE